MSENESRLWFGTRPRSREARVMLFCFPFSGGGASVYHAWRQLLPAEIEVVPVRLPGREARMREPAEISVPTIARVLAERIDLPFAIYGHSMGARVGFEVLRALRALPVPDPVRFYPAASLPPDQPDPFAACVELDDEPFVDALINHLGAPEELRDVSQLRRFQLPLLRNDLGWCHRYRYAPGPPLSTAIVAMAGQADRVATPAAMAGWSRQGQQGTVVTVAGGHFFVRTTAGWLTSVLARDLLGAVGGAGPAPGHIPLGTSW